MPSPKSARKSSGPKRRHCNKIGSSADGGSPSSKCSSADSERAEKRLRPSNTSSRSKTPSPAKNPHRSNTSSPSGFAHTPPNWRTWPELTVRVDNLPLDITTKQLLSWFSSEGTIVWMDIFEPDNKNMGTMSARVRFEPPPHMMFWERRRISVQHSDQSKYPKGLNLFVSLQRERPQGWWASKVAPDRYYPVKMKLNLRSLQFGSMVGPTEMNIVNSLHPPGRSDEFSIELDARTKRISVSFSVPNARRAGRPIKKFKFVADVAHMKEVYRTEVGEGSFAMIISLPFPPQYFWRKENIFETCSPDLPTWSIRDTWYRATDLAQNLDASLAHPVAIHNDIPDPEYIEIGRWTTFRFLVVDSPESQLSAEHMAMALEDLNIETRSAPGFKVHNNSNLMWKHINHPPGFQNGLATALLEISASPIIHLSFEVRYQLEVCVSRGILDEHSISPEFLQKLAEMEPFAATRRLEFIADQREHLYEPMDLFKMNDAEAYLPVTRVPHYCALVRKAVITPTTLRINTPAVETSNRVMRKYSHIQDRFLRVQFVEEAEFGRITINKNQNDDIWKRVYRTLYQGIQIGDRRYEFLAFGSSQLRQCGAYFFCPTDHISCDDIRQWMGQFNHIKIIAKYAARLGQCFSTTREIRGIHVPIIRAIPDIERNGYCFSDGVGIVSKFLARLIIEEMTLDVFDEPSAFQFRMGGCKGVLVVWDHAKGMEVHIRQSQEKFKADFKGLEIIRCAKLSSATLNRQTITILSSLGVTTPVFERLLDQQIHQYQKAGVDNNAAIELLTKFVDENQTSLILAELLKAGFKSDELQEPFVINLLNLWRSWSLKLLKEKARIHVEKGAFVLGCVDETGTLRGHSAETEGKNEKDVNKLPQIFLQLSDPRNYEHARIIKGVCIVGRNPSLHAGDIRVVQAVDNPKLRHLKDVVVFPSKGDRPVPNMLSGGDLDGDDFFVIWDPELIPKEWNHPPMNYTGSKPIELDRDVNVNDLRDFFVKYMKNDVLPLIATAHLAFADEHGPMSKKCIHLAELHSTAVDYPKTGESAEFSSKLQPKKWPHFMEKRNTYRSRKALGVIFDKVVKEPISFLPSWEHAFDKRITSRFELTNDKLKAARRIKSQYDTSVRRILSQYNVGTEFELFSGWAMSRPAIGSDYKRQEDLGQEYDALKHRFRDICYEAAGGQTSDMLDVFVAAMYKVTEEEVNIALFENHCGPVNEAGLIIPPQRLEPKCMPLISFPWIFHWVMIRIALGGKYKPKKSMLASARRKALASNLLVQPDSKESQKDKPYDNGNETLEDEICTKLPNGDVIHRGEPLILFDSDNDGPVEREVGDDGSEGNNDAEHPEDAAADDLTDVGVQQDNLHEHVTTELETATDRLASLLGFDED